MKFVSLVGLLPAVLGQIQFGYSNYEPGSTLVREHATTETFKPMAKEELIQWARDQPKGPYFYATDEDVDVSLKASSWTKSEKGSIWAHTFEMENAESMQLWLDRWYLPEGGAMWVYSDSETTGVYTRESHSTEYFSSEHVKGGSVTLEILVPPGSEHLTDIHIYKVWSAYRSADGEEAGRCNIHSQCIHSNNCSGCRPEDSSCSIQCTRDAGSNTGSFWADNDWEDQRRAGTRMSFGAGLCSGSMINNANGDPIYMTADHCTSGNPNSFSLNFNFRNSNCNSYDDNTGNPGHTVTGMSSLGSGSGGADVHMFRVTGTINSNWNVYLNGWDCSRSAPQQMVGIHHPGASNQKISHANVAGTISGTNWRVSRWSEATTEPGSSGSPLYNRNTKRIIGTLCCGTAACPAFNGYDLYGAMYQMTSQCSQYLGGTTGDGADYNKGAVFNTTSIKF